MIENDFNIKKRKGERRLYKEDYENDATSVKCLEEALSNAGVGFGNFDGLEEFENEY